MPIRALIFDFDGLILDTESPEVVAWQEVYAAWGCELALEVWVQCIGRPRGYFDAYAHLENLSGKPVDRDLVRSQRQARVRELNLAQSARPGIPEYLADARRFGLKIGLASSSDRAWVHGHLERLGLLDYFDTTKCAEDTDTHKPDPGPYLAALKALGVAATEAVVFEDSPNGIAAAKAAGIYCVAVPNPVTRGLDLSQANLRVESLAELTLEALLARGARGGA